MCITNPLRRGDTYIEAIKSHLLFSDELIVVDGGSTDGSLQEIRKIGDSRIKIVTLPWPNDWSWIEFATHWNFGYEHCSGDWVAAGETDHIWHEKEASRVKLFLNMPETKELAVAGAEKFQFVTIDQYFNKSGFHYFLNKGKYGDELGYGYDPKTYTDLAAPIFKTKEISPLFYEGRAIRDENYKKFRMSFMNYLWTFKTGDMILRERAAGLAGWTKFFKDQPYPGGEHMTQIKESMERSYTRLHRCRPIPFDAHPALMKEKLMAELKPGMFGYDLCGWNNGHKVPDDYYVSPLPISQKAVMNG